MATLNANILMTHRMFCFSNNCPNKNCCRHSVELNEINQFPAVYTVADMSSICGWYKYEKERDEQNDTM